MPEYVCCPYCLSELDGTGTCPNDCLSPISDEEYEALLTEQLIAPVLRPNNKETQ